MSTTNAVCSASPEGPVEVAVQPSLSFAIPPQDEEFFATQLPFKVQTEIRRLLNLCSLIHRSDNVMSACRRLAAQHSTLGRGYSASSLRTKYYNYQRSGDWRSMWNKAKAPVARNNALPPKFVEFVKQLAEQNQRKIAPAIENLYHIYRTRFDLAGKEYKTVPGYDRWPEADDFTGLPVGWSYANLQRKVTDLFQLTAARIGRSAARQYSLKVCTSRVDLLLGEYIQFDDHEFNLKVNFPGQRRAMRPKGFCAIDVLSACCFAHVLKPTLWDEEEEKKKVLTEKDFMWFVLHVLTTTGFRSDARGTALVVEWGTAAIRDWLEQRLHDATRGHVRVERSGKFGAPAHGGQAEGRTHGNFRFKALIESFFNIVDNYLALLPGQVGKDRNHSPEQLHGLERENARLLEAAAQLDAIRNSQSEIGNLIFPFLSWSQFAQQFTDILHRINSRTNHQLQGWEKLGFVAQEWRLPSADNWLPAAALEKLPAEERAVALALVNSNAACRRARQLSPSEVWDRQSSELHKLPLFKLPEIVGPEHARILTVRSGEFTFDDQEIDSDPIRFRAVDPKRGRLDGKFQCYVIPFNPSFLIACDAQNRVQGLCSRIIPPARNDVDGIKRMMGEAHAWEADALADLNARHLGQAREKAARHAHNASVISRSSRGNEAHTSSAPSASAEAPETIDLRPGAEPASNGTAARAAFNGSASDDSVNTQPETIDLR